MCSLTVECVLLLFTDERELEERARQKAAARADFSELFSTHSWLPQDFAIEVDARDGVVWLCLNLGLCESWWLQLNSQESTLFVDISSRLFLMGGLVQRNLVDGHAHGITFLELPPRTLAFAKQLEMVDRFCEDWRERGVQVEICQTPSGLCVSFCLCFFLWSVFSCARVQIAPFPRAHLN